MDQVEKALERLIQLNKRILAELEDINRALSRGKSRA